jgi:UDP-N-acetylglucosamine--N-acetylmuramyl-(pentapeptide) pyrophosphoryl-undecaprenol N-acetylglucosamine transferase
MTVNREGPGNNPDTERGTGFKSLRVVIAGGGTGGHLFPGIALAQAFIVKNPRAEILFVGAGNPFEKRAVGKAGFNHKSIPVEGIKGRNFLDRLKALLKIPGGLFESFKIIRDFKPDLVVGVGSYSSGPFIVAARISGAKIALHEQNIIPGITNRILSRFADRIYVSFEETKKRLSFQKALLAGNPLRREIVEAAGKNICARSQAGDKRFTVLILGGSQGAHKINTTVVETLPLLKNRDKYFFVHQTGTQDEKYVAASYEKSGFSCTVKPFFEDMAERYCAANLIICRSGATTVAEVTAMRLGAIFIPYPHAADDHQSLNAKALSDSGAAEMIPEKDLTAAILSERIEYFSQHPDELNKMALSAGRFGRPDAATVIVNDCCEIVYKKSHNNSRLQVITCLY